MKRYPASVRRIVFIALVSAAATANSPAATVLFDSARTTVEFTLGDVLHTVRGTLQLKSGIIHFDPGTGKASGSIVVDATSGASGSGARDAKMHKNILESARYPEISFAPSAVIGQVALDAPSQVQVRGIFRIHGVDHEITLPFQLQPEDGQIRAVTSFRVPFVKWGMKNPSNFLLKVNDTVEIKIRAVGRVASDGQ